MSVTEAAFKQDLADLQTALGKLQGDIEAGPVNKISGWYDQILDAILNFEDTTEDIIDARNGYDAESLEDEDVVESPESTLEETDDTDAEAEDEDLEYEDVEDLEDEEEVEDEDIEDSEDTEDVEVDDTETQDINVEAVPDSSKTITININFKPKA